MTAEERIRELDTDQSFLKDLRGAAMYAPGSAHLSPDQDICTNAIRRTSSPEEGK